MKLRNPLTLILCAALTLALLACPVRAAVVPVKPGDDWLAKSQASAPGDRLYFAAGTYPVVGNDANTTNLPGGRIYDGGKGAARFVAAPGNAHGKLSLHSGVEFTGFAMDNVNLSLESGDHMYVHGLKLLGNTGIDPHPGFSLSRISYITLATGGINGWVGDGVTIDHVRTTATGEAIHLQGPCNDLSILSNVITNSGFRWGVELQDTMRRLKVQGNYISAPKGPSISCATGGHAQPPYAGAGEDIDISGNILLAPGNGGACPLEIMGDKNIVVHDNVCIGFDSGFLNGTGGQAGEGLQTHDNVLVCNNPYSDGDNTPWPVPPRKSVNDHLYKLNDPNAPKAASYPVPNTAGAEVEWAGVQPIPTPVPVPVPTPTPTPTPVPAPVKVHQIDVYSDGSVKQVQ